MNNQVQTKQTKTAAIYGKSRNDEGFTLIELLIVMSVMLVLMTLGIPQLLKIRKNTNETSAIQSLRTIQNAEFSYNSSYPANGFSCALPALGGDPKSGAPSAQSAQLVPTDIAAGQKAGYTFAIINCNKTSINNVDQYNSFEVTAVPQAVGRTGDRGFCADENNVIRYDPAGGTNCTQPIQ